MIQFGYVTLFASAFPLGALFALAANLLQIRMDGEKFGPAPGPPPPRPVRPPAPPGPGLPAFRALAHRAGAERHPKGRAGGKNGARARGHTASGRMVAGGCDHESVCAGSGTEGGRRQGSSCW